MKLPIIFALMSVPFAAILIGEGELEEDFYIVSYVTFLGFIFAAILIIDGYQVLPIGSSFVIPSSR